MNAHVTESPASPPPPPPPMLINYLPFDANNMIKPGTNADN